MPPAYSVTVHHAASRCCHIGNRCSLSPLPALQPWRVCLSEAGIVYINVVFAPCCGFAIPYVGVRMSEDSSSIACPDRVTPRVESTRHNSLAHHSLSTADPPTLSQALQRIRSKPMPPVEISQTTPGSGPSTPVNVKLLLIGNASVGKSSLLLRFSDEAWIPEDEATATIGVDFRVSESRAPRYFV